MTVNVNLPIRRYSGRAVFFHWAMAVLIALSAMGGLLFDIIPTVWAPAWLNLHAVGGCTLLALFVGRVWWRMTYKPPPLPATTGKLNRQAAYYGQIGLYLAMGLVPLIGLVALLARGEGIDFGLFQIPALMERTIAVARTAKALHMLASYGLFVLVSGHIAAALYHQLILRDKLLARMMPEGKRATGIALAHSPVSIKSTKPLP